MDRHSKVIVLVPTEGEAMELGKNLPKNIKVVISGVGMVRTAAMVAVLAAAEPDALFVLAGIAGAYPHSGLQAGDCVVVGSERVADQGAFRDGEFMELYGATYYSAAADSIRSLPVVRSNSVNAGGSSFVDSGADMADGISCGIENMEGAAFFAVCLALGVAFIEVRAVSNITTDPRADWQIERAVESLWVGVDKVLKEIGYEAAD